LKRKAVSEIMLTLLLTSILTLAFNIQPVKAEPRTWYVDDDGGADFTKIQDAINAASKGDTIYVYNGTYHEHPRIYKDDLTIVGENKNDTIIDGDEIGAVVRVTAVNVTISGFTVQNSGWRWYYNEGSGFYLRTRHKTTRLVNISDNIVSNCYFGISLSNSIRNTINGNTISNAGVGVSFFDSAYNTLGDNTISNIEHDGVVFWNPSNNNVTGNLITNCSDGIRIRAGYENTIIGNTITEADYGVIFYLSDHNAIQENNITGSEWNGIALWNSSENTVTENNVANNRNGIVIQWSQNNSIYNNNILENTFQVITYDSVNIWDDGYPSGGNYWSDYSTRYPSFGDEYEGENQDILGSDGIWDHPYEIGVDNIDNYPLVEPWTPLPRTIDELKTEIEELGSEGEIDNQGIVKSLIAKLNVAQKLVDKGKVDEVEMVLEGFIMQVQELSEIHITVEAADILIQSAEYIISNL